MHCSWLLKTISRKICIKFRACQWVFYVKFTFTPKTQLHCQGVSVLTHGYNRTVCFIDVLRMYLLGWFPHLLTRRIFKWSFTFYSSTLHCLSLFEGVYVHSTSFYWPVKKFSMNFDQARRIGSSSRFCRVSCGRWRVHKQLDQNVITLSGMCLAEQVAILNLLPDPTRTQGPYCRCQPPLFEVFFFFFWFHNFVQVVSYLGFMWEVWCYINWLSLTSRSSNCWEDWF